MDKTYDNTNIKELLDSYITNSISAADAAELSRLLQMAQQQPTLQQYIDEYFISNEIDDKVEDITDNQLRNKIIARLQLSIKEKQQAPVRKLFNWKRWAVAASIILIVGLGSYFAFFNNPRHSKSDPELISKKDVEAPATNRAVIVLADGTKVYLDSTKNGTLAQQGNINVVKLANGQIAYQTAIGELLKEIQFNTLTNPRGSKVIDITLSDGSRVWLNAGSSLRYPVAFVGNKREVIMTGEGYFEIAKSFTASGAKQTFIVQANGTTTEVLGTHFNVNAYEDEAETKITLLEGSVNVSSQRLSVSAVTLKPGQQAVASSHSPFTIHRSPDLEQVMAWKNGKFSFNKADIKTVMRQLARWYDLEVEYKGTSTNDLFGGDMQRDLPLSKVLDFLKKSNVQFEVEGKKVIVQ